VNEPASDLLEALFEHTTTPTWIFDGESLRFLRVNQAAVERYGWTREEFLAMSLREIRHPDDVHKLEYTIADWRERPGVVRRTTRHRTKAGDSFAVDLEIARVHYEGRVAALVRVTDLVGLSEASLRDRMLVGMSSDGLAIVGEDRKMRYISPGGERIMGRSRAELVGKDTTYLNHPDDLAKLVYNPPGETLTYVTRVLHGDGSYRWIESTSKNLTRDPAVSGHLVAFRDVTRRVEAEAKLQLSEANLRTVLEMSTTLTFVHRVGVVQWVNRSLAERIGAADSSELVGKPAFAFIHPDDHEMVRKRIQLTISGAPPEPIEVHLVGRDGAIVIVEAQGFRLEWYGQPSTVVFCRDVTERHEMYARMAVADRMVSVGTLAAGVAHEINNPLAYVMGNLELLTRELPEVLAGSSRFPPSELYAIVNDAREGAIRVSTIVRELRALSRGDESSKGPISLDPVLASCMKMVGNELRHRARLVQDIAPDLPPIEGNASRLGQVFLNLLVNAAHAIPEGRADANSIRLRAYAEGTNVIVEISDTGVGIPPQVIGRIFDPFFTTKPIGQGTGLGLAISHEIVRSLGGSISVESTLGAGTTFRVLLPATIRPILASESGAFARVPALRVRALLIDDEVAVGRAICALLAPEIDVTHVTRGADALTRIDGDDRYDVVLCDLMMPDMSGIELFFELRAKHPVLSRRVVFLTGGAFTEQARDFLSRTEHPPVEKPFTEATLRAAIERVTSAASRA
jgi:PAS domain S-box-containing protein